MPFTAAGALIVLLVLGMISHAAWSRHQRSLGTIDDISSSAILATAAGIQGDIKSTLKYAVYRALWEVGKQADNYDDATRENAVERLATEYFVEQVAEIGLAYAQHDERVELDVPDSGAWPGVNLEEAEGGYALARVGFPEGTQLKLRSRDGSLSLVLPMENIEVFVDSRYFLLQERMGEFVERRGDICASWQAMEYLMAWGEAWLGGNVNLSDSYTKAFFETSWAIHEFNIFGSSDYWATAKGLIDAVGGDGGDNPLDKLRNNTIIVTPVRAIDMESMRGYIERALGSVQNASAHLEETKRCVRLARDNAARLSENIENSGEALENIRELLGEAVERIVEARGEISAVDEQFNQLLDFIASSAPNNLVMAALHESITSRALTPEYPSLKEQMGWGVGGALTRLSQLEQLITSASEELGDGAEDQLNGLFEQVTTSVDGLLSEPLPLRWVTFTVYENNPPRPVENRVPVYIDDEAGGTIGVLKIVLEGVKSSLDEMERFSQQYEPMPADLQEFEIDDELSSRLEGDPPEFVIDREEFYEILPPAPINSSPGLSVFHDFRIKEISNQRSDLAGRCGSPTATPIPLWFIGIVLWWGQWETTIQLEPGATEEIFDFDNPVLPMVYGPDYVHKPLAYQWEMPEEPLGINVIVVSLRPFTISSS